MGCLHHSAIQSHVNGDTVSDDDRDDEHEDGDDDDDGDHCGDGGGDGDDDDNDREDGDSVRSRDQVIGMWAILLRTRMSSTIVEHGIDVRSSRGEYRQTFMLQPRTDRADSDGLSCA